MAVPQAWMPNASMQRIICHWTSGAYKANSVDKNAYHLLVEGDGTLVRGVKSIKQNENPIRGAYAAHALNANGGSIGVSMCAMAFSKERPFDPGKYPVTPVQWDAMCAAVAELCRRYGIPVTAKTVLSHAEVQPTLGIAQRGKWDFTRLPFAPELVGHKACGDRLRADVARHLSGIATPTPPEPAPIEKLSGKIGTVTSADNLNFRRAPAGEIKGSLPKGTRVEINRQEGGWLNVTTPAGYSGWVAAAFVKID